jgi:hypothetical protein
LAPVPQAISFGGLRAYGAVRAVSLGVTLVTSNTREFERVKSLKVVDGVVASDPILGTLFPDYDPTETHAAPFDSYRDFFPDAFSGRLLSLNINLLRGFNRVRK